MNPRTSVNNKDILRIYDYCIISVFYPTKDFKVILIVHLAAYCIISPGQLLMYGYCMYCVALYCSSRSRNFRM